MGEVTPAFTYEVDAVMETEDGVAKCNESDADYWGGLRTPHHTKRVWPLPCRLGCRLRAP